jgi:hypothetical protein
LVRAELVVAGSNAQMFQIARTRHLGLADARNQRTPVIWPGVMHDPMTLSNAGSI